MKILVINAGSSSLKYRLFEMETEQVLAKGVADRIGIGNSFLKHTGKKEVTIDKNLPNHEVAIKEVLEVLTDPEYGVIKSADEYPQSDTAWSQAGNTSPKAHSLRTIRANAYAK